MKIKTEGKNIVVKIRKNLIAREYVEKFVERIAGNVG